MDSLVPLYRDMAKDTANFRGLSIVQHRDSIKKLIKRSGAKTVLDFGCGRGDAYRSPITIHNSWQIPRKHVTLYDPAFRSSSELPRGLFDVVLCSDVLEHVPGEEVDEFVKRLFGYAKKAVWASVCCRDAKKCFPGTETNMHVCVKPYQWWHDTFAEHAPEGIQWVLVETP